MKIRPVRAEPFHAERRTNMKKLVAFRNFANWLSKINAFDGKEHLPDFCRCCNYTRLKFIKTIFTRYSKTNYKVQKKYTFGVNKTTEHFTMIDVESIDTGLT